MQTIAMWVIIGGFTATVLAVNWRHWQRTRRIQPRLADLTTEAFNACNRCRTRSYAFPCTCTTDCHAAMCSGWLADMHRDVIRGDAQ